MFERKIIYPAVSPNLDGFRAHMRLTNGNFDETLALNLAAAISSAEHFIGRMISLSNITQISSFATEIELEAGDCTQLVSVMIDGVEVEASDYTFNGTSVKFKDGVTGDVVSLSYQAGMLNPAPDIIAAVYLHAGYMFNNPVDTVETLQKASTNLLRPYRRWEVR